MENLPKQCAPTTTCVNALAIFSHHWNKRADGSNLWGKRFILVDSVKRCSPLWQRSSMAEGACSRSLLHGAIKESESQSEQDPLITLQPCSHNPYLPDRFHVQQVPKPHRTILGDQVFKHLSTMQRKSSSAARLSYSLVPMGHSCRSPETLLH